MKQIAIIYGIGNTAAKTWKYLCEKYDIIHAVDSQESLWGKKWNGLDVLSPDSLMDYMGDVLVTTTDKYFLEIAQYLISKGIKKNKIFRVQQPICDQRAEVIPLTYIENLATCDIESAQTFSPRRVMVFCAFYSVYTGKLIRSMKIRFPELMFDVLSNSEQYGKELADYTERCYVYSSYVELESILRKIEGYEVFQFLWIENIWVDFANLLRRKCRRLNLCIGGSDFYRARKTELQYKKTLIDMADNISGESDDILADFVKEYPETKDKLCQVNFGLDILEEIDRIRESDVNELRDRFGIPKDKIIVTCGHNGNSSHQHEKMIVALEKIDHEIASKACFVFPMTYPQGNESYIRKVRAALDKSGLLYIILTDFMNEMEMATYAVMSDVLIHIQTTDQLSSTMLEEMYAGSVVIAGSWLPYRMIKERGIRFIEIDNFEELGKTIKDILCDYYAIKDKCAVNRKVVKELSSWDSVADKWMALWRSNDGQ